MTKHAAPTDTNRAGHAAIPRTRRGLLDHLALIDTAGWDSEAGSELLTYVRQTVIRPQLAKHRLSGVAAAQAESSAWMMTWRTLCSPQLRTATSPWGILWSAAGRAIADENVATAYATGARKAWQQRAEARRRDRAEADSSDLGSTLVSLDLLTELGYDTAVEHDEGTGPAQPAPLITEIASLLRDAGWDPDALCSTLVVLIDRCRHRDGHAELEGGWRRLALEAGISGWQARRLTHALLGTPTTTGLVALLAAGTAPRDLPTTTVAALRSTADPRMPSPDAVARKVLQVAS